MAARFWRMVAVMGAFGAAAYLARSFMQPASEPEPAPPRKRTARAARTTTHRGDDARRNGHGRAH